MAKQFSLDGIGDKPEFGKDGNVLDMSNGHAQFEDTNGNRIEVRAANATHANSLVTKTQLDSATGTNAGTLWIEYTTEPELSNFSANTRKLFDLTTGAADYKTDYSTIPTGDSRYDSSDSRTYIVDTTNGLIKPNAVDKQSHTMSIEIQYADVGSGTNTGVQMRLILVEYNGSTEQLEIIKQFRKSNNDSGNGTLTADFHTNVTSHVNGSGKGWRLYAELNEADSNAAIKIKSIRQKCG